MSRQPDRSCQGCSGGGDSRSSSRSGSSSSSSSGSSSSSSSSLLSFMGLHFHRNHLRFIRERGGVGWGGAVGGSVPMS